MTKYVEFRAFVGPEWLPKTSTYHYDWSALNLGAATTLPISTTLTSTLSAVGTSINVSSASSFPSAGGAWVGPAATGEGWEYFRYNGKGATSLNSMVRDSNNREHSGIHTSGASVYMWYPLTNNDGNLSWTWQSADNWSTNYWTGKLSGVLAPKNFLRLRHAIVIQRRTTPTGSWLNWLLGWITDAQTADSNRRDAPWVIEIGSSPIMIQRDDLPIFSMGTVNIAAGGTATAKSTMASAWKERASSDYVAAEPTFSASNVADDETSSLWISEREVGTAYTEYVPTVTAVNDPSLQYSSLLAYHLVITQIHITLAPGQPTGYRWFEITAMGDFSFTGSELYIGAYNGDSFGFGGIYSDALRNMVAGERVIICENADRFNEENPGNGAAQIVSLIDLGIPTFLENRSITNDSLGLWNASGAGNRWLHTVCWGTRTTVTIGLWAQTSPVWSGTTISSMTANSGKTLRYNWANSATAKNNYTYDLNHYPGYVLGEDPEWIMVGLPAMGITLKGAITSGFTGITTLTTAGGDSNIGLERSGSITLQIGSEQITATVSGSTQINITARNANGTTAAAHVAGDPVYVVVSGVATDAFKLKQIKWDRSGGTIYPKDFIAYTSTLEDPRTPDETGFVSDWSLVNTVTGNTSAAWASSAIATRPRWIMYVISKMTTDPARARLNTVIGVLDDATMDASTNIVSTDAGGLIEAMLGYVGVPTGAIANTVVGTDLDGNSTGKGKAWAVITDICDFASIHVDCDQMSKLSISSNNFWTDTIFTPSATWTRSNSNQPSFSARAGAAISQVQITWTTPDKATSGVSVYPATPSGTGEVVTYDNQIYESSGTADIAAQKRYLMANYGWGISIVPSLDDATDNESGQIHAVEWDIDPDVPDMSRMFLVTGVEHSISRRVPSTTISGVEIERYGNEQ